MNEIEAIRQIIIYMQPQCNHCGALYGGGGTPATRRCYFPSIKSHFDYRYFCDKHDFSCYKEQYLNEVKEHWENCYDLNYPPKEFEFQDLPYAEAIRSLIAIDFEWWENRNQSFEERIKKDNLFYKK